MHPTRTGEGVDGSVWMVEGYLPARSSEQFAVLVGRIIEQIGEAEGGPVRLLQHAVLPEDEMYLLVFAGPSAQAVEELSVRAGLAPERITRAVQDPSLWRAEPG
jgi:hypothetical protein